MRKKELRELLMKANWCMEHLTEICKRLILITDEVCGDASAVDEHIELNRIKEELDKL